MVCFCTVGLLAFAVIKYDVTKWTCVLCLCLCSVFGLCCEALPLGGSCAACRHGVLVVVCCSVCAVHAVQCMLHYVYCAVCTAHAVRRCAVVQSYCHAVLSAVLCLLCGADVQRVLRSVRWCCSAWRSVLWWRGGGPVWYPGACVVPCPVVWWVRPVCGCPRLWCSPSLVVACRGLCLGVGVACEGGVWCRPALVVGWVGFCRK